MVVEFNGDGEKRYVSPRSLVLESLEIVVKDEFLCIATCTPAHAPNIYRVTRMVVEKVMLTSNLELHFSISL